MKKRLLIGVKGMCGNDSGFEQKKSQGDKSQASSRSQHQHKHTKAVLDRLARAIGHLSSVRCMVEQGRDCSEILIQLAAVRSAISKTCEVIIKDHLEHCIVDAINTGDSEALDELNRAVEMLMK